MLDCLYSVSKTLISPCSVGGSWVKIGVIMNNSGSMIIHMSFCGLTRWIFAPDGRDLNFNLPEGGHSGTYQGSDGHTVHSGTIQGSDGNTVHNGTIQVSDNIISDLLW